jgi:outer membrane protein assembly factor BamE (lipoprotein component of BamABCDE complex)
VTTAESTPKRPHRRLRRLLLVALVLVAGWIGLRALAYRQFASMNQPFFGKVEAIQVGMTKAEVLQRLGPPNHLYRAGSAPEHYYVSGYTHRRRPIEGEVMIYLGGFDMIAYLYLDRNGRTEDKFVGGS